MSGRPLGPDHAVLLRQIARWTAPDPLFVGSIPEELEQLGKRAGYSVGADGYLKAIPFAPLWLTDDAIDSTTGIDYRPESRRPDESIAAEHYLRTFGFNAWHSQAQKEAVWTALSAAPDGTTLVALPTGAGKSLCFQIIARLGKGLTIVVVPTVALAMDHWKSTSALFADDPSVSPRYYTAETPEGDNEAIIDAVANGRTRLLFTSPEAITSGRLRRAVAEAASAGRLEALVVDEAHMIDTWGQYFRVDFQVLAAVRRLWRDAAREYGGGFKTVLLSATVTPECRELLQLLFTEAGTEWREFVSQRLRPEMTYYMRQFADEATRQTALTECLWHLPRPAIVYTTRVEDAEALARHAREMGFQRIGCFHGETRNQDRLDLLTAWRNDQIDLMVATSAFGMGVDKRDVRAVVHACLPEDLNRYYQEVGRSGRDGASSVCILLPTGRDWGIAKKLGATLLGIDRLQERWEALWASRRAHRDSTAGARVRWDVRLDAKPLDMFGDRTGGEHILWNKRLLLQLQRSRMLVVCDIRREWPDDPRDQRAMNAGTVSSHCEPVEWATVDLAFAPDSPRVGSMIEGVRKRESDALDRGLRLMGDCLLTRTCISSPLRRLYGRDTARACGGCPNCRRTNRRVKCPELPLPLTGSDNARVHEEGPVQCVVSGVMNPAVPANQPAFVTMLRRTIRERGCRRFFCPEESYELLAALLGRAIPSPDERAYYRLDTLNPDVERLVHADEAVVVFHTTQVSERALAIFCGRSVTHLIFEGNPYRDRFGRRPLELRGVPHHLSPESWLREA